MDLDVNRSLIVAALARIPRGDRAALQTVYRLTSGKLFGVALRILGERTEAEDVCKRSMSLYGKRHLPSMPRGQARCHG